MSGGDLLLEPCFKCGNSSSFLWHFILLKMWTNHFGQLKSQILAFQGTKLMSWWLKIRCVEIWRNKRTIDSFACPNKKEQNSKKFYTKLKNDNRIFTGAENLQKCSKCNLPFPGNPYPNRFSSFPFPGILLRYMSFSAKLQQHIQSLRKISLQGPPLLVILTGDT